MSPAWLARSANSANKRVRPTPASPITLTETKRPCAALRMASTLSTSLARPTNSGRWVRAIVMRGGSDARGAGVWCDCNGAPHSAQKRLLIGERQPQAPQMISNVLGDSAADTRRSALAISSARW